MLKESESFYTVLRTPLLANLGLQPLDAAANVAKGIFSPAMSAAVSLQLDLGTGVTQFGFGQSGVEVDIDKILGRMQQVKCLVLGRRQLWQKCRFKNTIRRIIIKFIELIDYSKKLLDLKLPIAI